MDTPADCQDLLQPNVINHLSDIPSLNNQPLGKGGTKLTLLTPRNIRTTQGTETLLPKYKLLDFSALPQAQISHFGTHGYHRAKLLWADLSNLALLIE